MIDGFGIEPIFILRTHLRKGGNTDRNRKENIFLSSGMYLTFLPAYMHGQKKKQNKTKETKKQRKLTHKLLCYQIWVSSRLRKHYV